MRNYDSLAAKGSWLQKIGYGFVAALLFALTPSLSSAQGGTTCGTAEVVPGSGSYSYGSQTGGGASNNCYGSATNARWYSFTPGSNGTLDVKACGGIDTRLSIYTGACGLQTCIAQSDDDGDTACQGSGFASSVIGQAVTGGTTYYIEWDDRWSASGSSWTLTFTPSGGGGSDCCTPGGNGTPGCDDGACEALICGGDPFCCDTSWDGTCATAAISSCAVCAGGGSGLTCGDAEVITPGAYTYPALSGTGASNNCFTGATAAYWYEYTPAGDGTVDIFSCGTVDARVSVYTGACGGQTCVASNDDYLGAAPGCSASTLTSSIEALAVTGGTTYYIEWDDRWSSASAGWELQFTAAPTGEDCASATAVTPGSYTSDPLTGTGASNNCWGSGGTAARWYSWTAPGPGEITVYSCDDGFDPDTRLSVYSGSCGSLVCEDFNDDDDSQACQAPAGLQSTVAGLVVSAGTTYYFEWDDRWSTTGFDWTFEFAPDVPGADCVYSSSPGSFITTGSPVSDIITVAVGPEQISDMNVFIDITHTFSGDLDIALESPNGTVVDLVQDICGSDDNMFIEFDDEGSTPYATCPSAGTFMVPLSSLAAFDGEFIDGDWTLTVTDDAGGDDGTLNTWCLIPTTVAPSCLPPTLTFNQSNTDCDDETFDWSLDIAADGDAADYDVYVNTPTMPDCGASQAPSAGFPSDPACEAAICAADSWCCTNEWDAICADAALLEPACSGCVGGSSGSSTFIGTFTGGTSGIALGNFSFSTNAVVLVEHNDDSDCNQTEPVVNTEVCGCTDPLAVNTDPGATVNDGSCVYPPANDECDDAQAIGTTPYPGASNTLGNLQGAGDENGLPSCGFTVDSFFDIYYEFTVSEENHFIVNVDPISSGDLAVEVLDACGGTVLACGNTSSGGPDCATAQGTPGFPSDPACEAAICGADAFCCDTSWDSVCASDAALEPACAGCVGGSPAVPEVNLLLENLAPGTYTIRVGANGTSPNLSNAFFLVNVQSFPTAQVQDSPSNPLYACNQGGFQLEDFVGAEPQTTPGLGILDYEWLVAEEGGGTLTEWERGEPNYVSRCEWLGMDYGKTYNVFVRLLIDHPVFGPTWGVYQGDYSNPFDLGASSCTISTASNVTPTEIRPNYTPTNAQGNDYALCDFVVAYNVSNSENFRWRFDGNGTPGDLEDIIYTRGSGNPSVRLSWVNGLIPGTTYQVAVEVQVAGNWSGYSTVLPVTLALPPNTVQLRSAWCDGTATSYVLSESVCAADTYTFEFVDQGDASVHTFTSGNYVCFLNNLSPAIAPGTYDVRVKVSQGGIAGDFGGICVVTIGGPTAPGAGEASALRDIAVNGSATLFPNPNAGDEVRVNLDGLSAGNHEVMISVYDVYGKQISTQGFGHEGESLSRLVRFDGGLAMGMYMVQIVVDGESFTTERLIVK